MSHFKNLNSLYGILTGVFLSLLLVSPAFASTKNYTCSDFSLSGVNTPTCSSNNLTFPGPYGHAVSSSGFYTAGNTYYLVFTSIVGSGAFDFSISGDNFQGAIEVVGTSATQNITLVAPTGNTYYDLNIDGSGTTGNAGSGSFTDTTDVICVSDTSFAECGGGGGGGGGTGTTTIATSTIETIAINNNTFGLACIFFILCLFTFAYFTPGYTKNK